MIYPFFRKNAWIFALLIFASCSVQEEIHFKKDFSGKVSYTIDLSSMMSMAKSFAPNDSTSESDNQDMSFDDLETKFNQYDEIEGITNFQYDSEESGIVKFSFDFASLEALNAAYQKMSESNDMANFPGMGGGGFTPGEIEEEEKEEIANAAPKELITHFTRKGKTLVFRPRKGVDPADMQDKQEALEMMKNMGAMLKMETKFTFDRTIKKVSAKGLEAYSDDHSLKMSQNIFEMDDPKRDLNPQISIKLK